MTAFPDELRYKGKRWLRADIPDAVPVGANFVIMTITGEPDYIYQRVPDYICPEIVPKRLTLGVDCILCMTTPPRTNHVMWHAMGVQGGSTYVEAQKAVVVVAEETE